jgi:hypothetical protein
MRASTCDYFIPLPPSSATLRLYPLPLPVPEVPRRLVSQLFLITKGVDLPFKKVLASVTTITFQVD